MSTVISVCNRKGGAGKSTIAVNLACAIDRRGDGPIVIVDADRQGTALAWGAQGALPVPVFAAPLPEARPADRYPGMLWLTRVKELAQQHGSLVIDLPSGLEFALAAVTAISDVIVVPITPSGVDFHSSARFVRLIQEARKLRGTGKPDCIILPNRMDARTRIARDLSPYRQFGERIAGPVHARTIYSEAFDSGQWVGDASPGSDAQREIERLAACILGGPARDPARPAERPVERPAPRRARGIYLDRPGAP